MRTEPYRGLNVGSGLHPDRAWVNFDYLPQPSLDLRADLFALPFPADTFTKVYVGHTLEHLPWDSIPAALAEIRRVMAPGGVMMVVGPDLERALRTHQPTHIIEAILKHGEGPGAHYWTATGLLTLTAVRTVFPDAAEVPVETVSRPSWPNPTTVRWQCAVAAEKEAEDNSR